MNDLMISRFDFAAHPDRYRLIDVRDAAEFSVRHIPGATNVPLATLQSGDLVVPKDKVVVTVCGKGGGHSGEAAAMLHARGLSAVWLEGGTIGWFEKERNLADMTASGRQAVIRER